MVCNLDKGSVSLLYTLKVQHGFYWTLSLRGKSLDINTCPLLAALPQTLRSLSCISVITKELNSYHVCEGNFDERFLKLSRLRKGVFMDTSGQMYASDIYLCSIYV